MKTLFAILLVGFLGVPGFANDVQMRSVEVTNKGFVPSELKVEANKPVVLNVTRRTDKTCAKKLTIPDYNTEKELPLNETVAVKFTPTKEGKVKFGCGMQMVGGVLFVE